MAVSEQTPLKEYVANGVTRVFPLGFDCENKDHLIVTIDGEEVSSSTWSLANKEVTFLTAPLLNKNITFQRNTPYSRDRNYQTYDNSFRPEPVNKDFDWIWFKLQELGVADWILGNRITALKKYVDDQDDKLQLNINNLKSYVDKQDNELRSYLMDEIRKQGVALDQLDDYYNYLMQRLAQIAVDRGWSADFVVTADGSNQQQVNDRVGNTWREKTLGYNQNDRVMLDNGDIVKSTVANNTKNPNVDMTGWVKDNSASQIFDGPLNQHQINRGLNSLDEMLAIQNPVDGMRVKLNSFLPINYALRFPHVGGGEFIYASSKSSVNDGGLIINGWVRQNYTAIKPEFFGADPSGNIYCNDSFNKCFLVSKGLSVELDGHYKFNAPIVIDYNNTAGLRIFGGGSSLHDGANGTQKTVLDFDALPANSTAITLKRIRGLSLYGFHITHSTSYDDTSITMLVTTLDDFLFENVTLKNTNGASSTGIQFGINDGVDCAFMGTLKNAEINMLRGRATAIMSACTSINHINCYQQGGYFYSYKSQYCLYQNCASESSPAYGYVAESSKSLTYLSCAGEANALGTFTVKRGSSNISYISPYGAENKGVYGTLLYIDGRYGYNANIHVSNPVSISNPNVRYSIYSDLDNGVTEVNNIYTPNLQGGIGGSDKWKQNCLITTGDYVADTTFEPVLSGFIAATPPTVTASFERSGRSVTVNIRVKPSVATTTDASTTITIPKFGGIRADTVASVVGINNTNYGSCLVDSNGVIHMPVISTAFSASILISFTLITNHAIE